MPSGGPGLVLRGGRPDPPGPSGQSHGPGPDPGDPGDILVFPRWADVLATAPAAELLLSDWTDAGRVRLHTAPLPLAQLTPPQEKTKEIRDTVSSCGWTACWPLAFPEPGKGRRGGDLRPGPGELDRLPEAGPPGGPGRHPDSARTGEMRPGGGRSSDQKGRVFVTLKRYL